MASRDRPVICEVKVTSAMIEAGVAVFMQHVGDEPRVYEPYEIVERIMTRALDRERDQRRP